MEDCVGEFVPQISGQSKPNIFVHKKNRVGEILVDKYIMLYYIILYYIILFYYVLYYIILFYYILYYIILSYIILYSNSSPNTCKWHTMTSTVSGITFWNAVMVAEVD